MDNRKHDTLRNLVIGLFLVNFCLAVAVGGAYIFTRATRWLESAGISVFDEVGAMGAILPRLEEGDDRDKTDSSLTATSTPKFSNFLPFARSFGKGLNPRPYPGSFEQADVSWVENTLAGMTIEQKVGQLMLVGVDGNKVNQENCSLIKAVSPAGVFYQEGGNVFGPDQLRQFSEELEDCNRESSSVPLLFAIDHEGVYIHRFKDKVTTFPSALAFAATGEPELAYRAARAAGEELSHSGISMVLGPVADVLLDLNNSIFSNRTFGGDPGQAKEFVAAVVRGYQDAELIPVVKHFPGHGGVATDPHKKLPIDSVGIDRLRRVYLPTFRSGLEAGAQVVMIGHSAFPGITGNDVPATLSPEMVSTLRQELDFDGVILSDALNMKAVSRSSTQVPDSAVGAIQAGLDMVLVNRSGQVAVAYQGLVDAVRRGEISEERITDSVRRVLLLKAAYHRQYSPFGYQNEEPDWAAHKALEREAGYKSVTVIRDKADLVPLPQDRPRVMIVGASADWGFYPVLLEALREKGFQPDLFAFSEARAQRTPEELAYPQVLPQTAQNYDLILVFTYESHIKYTETGDDYQGLLVRSLVGSGKPVLAVAVRAPTDILQYPDVLSYITLYGTPDGTLEGLLSVLLGDKPAVGRNPLPNFP